MRRVHTVKAAREYKFRAVGVLLGISVLIRDGAVVRELGCSWIHSIRVRHRDTTRTGRYVLCAFVCGGCVCDPTVTALP